MTIKDIRVGWLYRFDITQKWYPIAAVMKGGCNGRTIRIWVYKNDYLDVDFVTHNSIIRAAIPPPSNNLKPY